MTTRSFEGLEYTAAEAHKIAQAWTMLEDKIDRMTGSHTARDMLRAAIKAETTGNGRITRTSAKALCIGWLTEGYAKTHRLGDIFGIRPAAQQMYILGAYMADGTRQDSRSVFTPAEYAQLTYAVVSHSDAMARLRAKR